MSRTEPASTPCWIYRSSNKDEMYLYLAREEGFDELPEPLRRLFGTPTLVMNLQLTQRRPLAREDVASVISALDEQGYYLQMPPKLEPRLYEGDGI